MTTDETLAHAARLAEAGAVLHLYLGSEPVRFLVGHFQRLDDGAFFFFEAHHETSHGGHVVNFDQAESPHDLAVRFTLGGQPTAYLTAIGEEEDAAELAVRWQSWQIAKPAKMPFIQDTLTELTSAD